MKGAHFHLAPAGRLRAVLNLGNSVLVTLDALRRPFGVAVDMAALLASRLGCDVEYVLVDTAAKAVDTLRGEGADIGFFANDPARCAGMVFTSPYLQIEASFVVPNESIILANEQVDRTGCRVLVSKGSAYDLYLTRTFNFAELRREGGPTEVLEAFSRSKCHVAAGIRQQLESEVARLPGYRILPGSFMMIEQAMALCASRSSAAADFLRGFVEGVKADGTLDQWLLRHGIRWATVARVAT
jgi:polar amino acid transport system substrate-binding protein